MGGILVSHAVGNANVRALLQFWNDHGRLHSFATTVGISANATWPKFLPGSLRNQMSRRLYPVQSNLLQARPWRELARQLAGQTGMKSLVRHETGWASIDAVCQDLDHGVAERLRKMRSLPRLVYGYEDSSRDTFAAAAELGVGRVYEITIGHYATFQKLMKEEAERVPEFAASIEALWDSERKLARKDEELGLANQLIASSEFVRETLISAGIPKEKIHVVQFGAPEGLIPFAERRPGGGGPLRLLFAGRIGQRKGIAYLLQAVERLNRRDVELILLGEMIGGKSLYQPYARWFRHEAPRPHAEVLSLMQQCDLLVLPTLFEGQALVVLEAMKCGLPVLTTPNSGAVGLVRDGVEGFIVPIRSVEALMEKIEWSVEHRSELQVMGEAARIRAGNFSWRSYARQVDEALGGTGN